MSDSIPLDNPLDAGGFARPLPRAQQKEQAHRKEVNRWSLVDTHGLVLFFAAANPDADPSPDSLDALGLTERRVSSILTDLMNAGLLTIIRPGRRNSYAVNADAHFLHPTLAHIPLSRLTEALRPAGSPRNSRVRVTPAIRRRLTLLNQLKEEGAALRLSYLEAERIEDDRRRIQAAGNCVTRCRTGSRRPRPGSKKPTQSWPALSRSKAPARPSTSSKPSSTRSTPSSPRRCQPQSPR